MKIKCPVCKGTGYAWKENTTIPLPTNQEQIVLGAYSVKPKHMVRIVCLVCKGKGKYKR